MLNSFIQCIHLVEIWSIRNRDIVKEKAMSWYTNTIIRYIPIEETITKVPIVHEHISVTRTTTLIHTIPELIGRPQIGVYAKPHAIPIDIPLTLFIVILSMFLFLLVKSILYKGEKFTVSLPVIKGKKVVEGIRYSYSYRGIKDILRRIFVNMKRVYGFKPSTTIREMSTKIDSRVREFAELYEDIVYGDIPRQDVEKKINEFKEFLEGDSR